ELSQAWQEVHALAQDGEDVQDTLEAIEGGIEDKVENIAKVVKAIDAEGKALKEEEKRISDRRKAMENQAKRLKEYAEEAMRSVGMNKIKGNLFTVAIQKNPPSVDIVDPELIPEIYWTPQEPALNKKELTASLK